MAIKFYADEHKYESIDASDNIDWISVTRLIHFFKEPFDEIKMSESCSKGKNPKYCGKTPEEIRAIWKAENTRAVTLGSWYHDQREKDILSCNTITRRGLDLPIIHPLMDGPVKIAPEQALVPGIYPEHFIYLKSAGICGQADRVEVVGDTIDLYDFKTNKEIKKEGFKMGTKTKKMLGPLSHLDDCNFNDYSLQLSIYMFMMLKHNYNLEPGIMQIEHIEFEIDHIDKNGYPVTKLDKDNNPIVKAVTPHAVPYLKKEVNALFNYLKINRHKLKKNEH
ncbi:MAG: hypothetical protein RIR01_2368 [Bacteroidota bacterium]|jgi:hypothetical protein